jgi:hypothetical protein
LDIACQQLPFFLLSLGYYLPTITILLSLAGIDCECKRPKKNPHIHRELHVNWHYSYSITYFSCLKMPLSAPIATIPQLITFFLLEYALEANQSSYL